MVYSNLVSIPALYSYLCSNKSNFSKLIIMGQNLISKKLGQRLYKSYYSNNITLSKIILTPLDTVVDY